jgi:hypothetical protein
MLPAGRWVVLLASVGLILASVAANVSDGSRQPGSPSAGLRVSAIAPITDGAGAASRVGATGGALPATIAPTRGPAPTRPETRVPSSSSELPYGFELFGASVTFASAVLGVSFAPGSPSCSSPSENVTPSVPVVLSAAVELACLNGASSGLISSVWSSNLSNFTTYQNGSTAVLGCPPIPPFTEGTGCAFYASGEYTGFVPIWLDDAPVNSSQQWEPDLTGLSPDDVVFAVALGANNSTPTNTLYSLTVKIAGPMPSPVTFYVRTPTQTWSGERNLTLLLDLDLAWFSTLSNSSTPMVYPEVGGYSVSMNYVRPCSTCYVNFVESGLGSPSRWSVTMNGSAGSATLDSSGSSLAFREPNGSYTFTAATVGGCSGSPSTGTLAVDGSDQSVAIDFTTLSCPITFAETGLPSGTAWSVVVDRVTHASATSSIVVREPDGASTFRVTNLSGYTVSPSAGTVEVSAASVRVPLTFSPASKAATFLGLPVAEGYALVGGLAAVVIAAGLVLGILTRKRGGSALGPAGAPPPPPSPPPESH